jgi:hypothetical protein
MLDLKCDKCGRDLSQPGALIVSPPTTDGWLVENYHLRVECWPPLLAELREAKLGDQSRPGTH